MSKPFQNFLIVALVAVGGYWLYENWSTISSQLEQRELRQLAWQRFHHHGVSRKIRSAIRPAISIRPEPTTTTRPTPPTTAIQTQPVTTDLATRQVTTAEMTGAVINDAHSRSTRTP